MPLYFSIAANILLGVILHQSFSRKEQVILNRLLIDHTHLSHSYLVNIEQSPNCDHCRSQLNGSVKEPDILIYFFFPPITESCSVSDVLFTGGRGVSDFSVLKYY